MINEESVPQLDALTGKISILIFFLSHSLILAAFTSNTTLRGTIVDIVRDVIVDSLYASQTRVPNVIDYFLSVRRSFFLYFVENNYRLIRIGIAGEYEFGFDLSNICTKCIQVDNGLFREF